MRTPECWFTPTRESESGRVRVAVAGLGAFGTLHARAYAESPKAVLSAVCDLDSKRLNETASSLGVRKKYTDFDELLDEGEFDLLSIATPDKYHFSMAAKAARKGKSILLEKPMCSSLAEADQLVELARQNKTKLMVDFILRFDPRYLKAREIIEGGDIGQIATIYARRHVKARLGKAHARFSNLYVDVAIHDIDVAMWYTSARPVEVRSRERTFTCQGRGHHRNPSFWERYDCHDRRQLAEP